MIRIIFSQKKKNMIRIICSCNHMTTRGHTYLNRSDYDQTT